MFVGALETLLRESDIKPEMQTEGFIVQPRGRKSFHILGTKCTEGQGRGGAGCIWMNQVEQG